jgi:trehalose 6-phosphate synthase/phosphatase
MMHLKDMKVILSVDRLDYTKGILERLRAFQNFLSRYPEYQGKVRFYLIVAPSRAEIGTYTSLLEKIREAVSETNGKFGTLNWMPVWFFYRSYPQDTLIRFYRQADVMLVTPLRDGMNLVAKEYIASRNKYEGMLVISETAGAASQLVEAVIVNPKDFRAIADGIKTALEMPQKEKITRNMACTSGSALNVEFWARIFCMPLPDTHTYGRDPEMIVGKNSQLIEKLTRRRRKGSCCWTMTALWSDFIPAGQAQPDRRCWTAAAVDRRSQKHRLHRLRPGSAGLEQWLGRVHNLYYIASTGSGSNPRQKWT